VSPFAEVVRPGALTTPFAEVVRPGALTTVQDRGRPGLAHLGVPHSGALDRGAQALANRLVGNPDTAATLETTMDGVAFKVDMATTVAVTGAAADVTVDGESAAWALPLYLRAGQTLDVGVADAGVRSYVAVAGGFEVEPVLGSRSTDLLSGLGPPALRTGDRLPLGAPRGTAPAIDIAPYRQPGVGLTLTLHPGPRVDWLSAAGLETLAGGAWTVLPDSNRIALRLGGPAVERSRHDELASEGIVLGAVQSLPDGGLVMFLADHPTTGGYPVVAVVDPDSLDACAQARPGATVRMVARW
jgi:biotin-dependent carboxylase-like uncharacterized protein